MSDKAPWSLELAFSAKRGPCARRYSNHLGPGAGNVFHIISYDEMRDSAPGKEFDASEIGQWRVKHMLNVASPHSLITRIFLRRHT